ncbi:homeobox protein cut [Calliphora vicina]|uniref:homeobox protein cut n=1 Tax=Calliphora vicina TaxID=7373 RepID=UPI00325A87B3
MDDGEFNLSNTIGIGLNIGEQMLLPVSNGEEEAQIALQQQHHHQQQHLHEQQQQQQHHQHHQQAHYVSNLNIEHQSGENVNNTPETTTNVTCLDNSIGNFYQENTDLEDLNAKLAETTKILEYTPVEKPTELLTTLQEENREKAVVEELGSIATEAGDKNKVDDKKINEEEEDETEDKEDNEDEEEDVEEIEAEVVEGEDEEIEEVDDEDEVEEEIIPDEVIVPENTEDKIKEIKTTESDKEGKEKDDEGEEDDAEENEDSQNNEDDESEQPTSSIRAARRKEEHVDENQCRVCCATDNLVSIFKKVEERTVADLLMTICPSVSIAIKDFLPQYICNACCDNVVIAIKLKTQCETTEKELRKKLSRHKNKIRRPVGYVVIDAPLDSDPPTDDEQANDEEFKVSDIASATPSEDSDTSDFSDSKKKRTRSRKRRKSAVVTPTDGKRSKTKSKSDDQSSDEDNDDGDPIKQKRKRSSNSSPENFACNECGQTFSRKQSLVLHKRQHVYDRGEPIKCEVCGKKFKIKGAYRTHLEKHREERRANKCTQCSRRFGNSSDLKRHIAEEHKEKSILPTCSKCNRTFSSAGRLQRHKQNVCSVSDSSKFKKSETHAFAVGTDLFKAVAPLQSTYWSDSFSD